MITTFENRCVLKIYVIVIRPIFDTTFKGEIQVKIYIRALHHELVLFQKSRNCFHCVPENEIEEDILVWNPSNTRLFYELIRQNKFPETSIFADLVSNYDLVVHSIAYLSLQRVDVSKESILCTFTTIQNMNHSVRTVFGDSKKT